jgi:hypothetical protein
MALWQPQLEMSTTCGRFKMKVLVTCVVRAVVVCTRSPRAAGQAFAVACKFDCVVTPCVACPHIAVPHHWPRLRGQVIPEVRRLVGFAGAVRSVSGATRAHHLQVALPVCSTSLALPCHHHCQGRSASVAVKVGLPRCPYDGNVMSQLVTHAAAAVPVRHRTFPLCSIWAGVRDAPLAELLWHPTSRERVVVGRRARECCRPSSSTGPRSAGVTVPEGTGSQARWALWRCICKFKFVRNSYVAHRCPMGQPEVVVYEEAGKWELVGSNLPKTVANWDDVGSTIFQTLALPSLGRVPQNLLFCPLASLLQKSTKRPKACGQVFSGAFLPEPQGLIPHNIMVTLHSLWSRGSWGGGGATWDFRQWLQGVIVNQVATCTIALRCQ